MNGISTSAWFPIARLLRPQGRRGELLADPLSDLPGLFDNQHDVVLAAADASLPAPGATPLRIEEHWLPTGKNAGRVVLKLSGCDSISAAEALAGQQLLIARSQLPALDPGTFFVGDLLGCTLYNITLQSPAGEPVGTVVDVEFATAPDGRTRLEDAAPLLAVELLTHTPHPPSPSSSPSSWPGSTPSTSPPAVSPCTSPTASSKRRKAASLQPLTMCHPERRLSRFHRESRSRRTPALSYSPQPPSPFLPIQPVVH